MYRGSRSLSSINRVQEYVVRHEVGFYEALRAVDLIPNIGRGASKLESFVALIEHFKTDAQEMSISGLMKEIIEEIGYVESWKLKTVKKRRQGSRTSTS